MPLFTIVSNKIISTNEEKTVGISVEFPTQMPFDELANHLTSIIDAIKKTIEEEKKKESELPQIIKDS